MLASSVGDVRIGGMKRKTDKLSDLQVAVEIAPADRRVIIQTPDAAVVAIQQPSRSIEADGVMIGVRPAAVRAHADVGPGGAAVQATDDGNAAGVNDV